MRRLRGGGEYPATGVPRSYAFRSTRYGEGVRLYRSRGTGVAANGGPGTGVPAIGVKRGSSSVSFSTSICSGSIASNASPAASLCTTGQVNGSSGGSYHQQRNHLQHPGVRGKSISLDSGSGQQQARQGKPPPAKCAGPRRASRGYCIVRRSEDMVY